MTNSSSVALKCPLCNNTKLDRLFQASDYISSVPSVVYRCRHCDLVVTEPGPAQKNIRDPYGKGYYGQRKFLVENIINRARVRTILKFKGPETPLSMLDVGCGNGTFLMRMRKYGWQAFGTEIAPADHMRQGVDEFIRKGDFIISGFSKNSFDMVTMWHSLEHVKNPLDYAIESNRVLRQGGTLLVEIPNFESLQAKIFKENWFHLDVPRHLFHFSPKSISILFQKAGFNVISIKRGSSIYSLFGCLQSILNSVSIRSNLFFDYINKKISLANICKENRKDLFINIAIFAPALLVSTMLFLVEMATHKSGIILVLGRKSN